MANKKTLDQKIDALTIIIEKMDARMEKGFAAVAEDVAGIKANVNNVKLGMATKNQIIALQSRVNSIEHQLRDTKMELTSRRRSPTGVAPRMPGLPRDTRSGWQRSGSA